ncbi:tripartite tricarboxylate transporter TctB family protein [Cytobacillus oceanisediminis]|uniref:tripartite tricarboxylate transporter TctB family protein n=1 Tax=Cytobacillus oceanisediminis TaxID=665099 RepID=UPI003BAFB19A
MPQQISTVEASSINARTIPRLIAIVILICSLLLIIQGFFFTEKKEVNINKSVLLKEFRGIGMIFIFIGYGFIIDKLGFTISSLLLCTSCLLFYKVKNWKYYAVTCAVVFIVYFVFANALNVNLP